MKKRKFIMAILAVALVFVLALASCDNAANGGGDESGILTITNIPLRYNGKYGIFMTSYSESHSDEPAPPSQYSENPGIGGAQNINRAKATGIRNPNIWGAENTNMAANTVALAQISNGRVRLPMWIFNEYTYSITRYYGYDTVITYYYGNEYSNERGICGFYIFDNRIINVVESEDIFQSSIAAISFPSISFSNGSATVSWNYGSQEW